MIQKIDSQEELFDGSQELFDCARIARCVSPVPTPLQSLGGHGASLGGATRMSHMSPWSGVVWVLFVLTDSCWTPPWPQETYSLTLDCFKEDRRGAVGCTSQGFTILPVIWLQKETWCACVCIVCVLCDKSLIFHPKYCRLLNKHSLGICS